jgi:Na+/melibiose symporter-like transporter
MNEPRVQSDHFKVDTRRPRSRSKMRSKLRHILAVTSGMFPLMALFIYLMSWSQLPEQRKGHYMLAIIFLACGMVALIFYAWARSEKMRRREVSARNREQRYRDREEAFLQEQEKIQTQKAVTVTKED